VAPLLLFLLLTWLAEHRAPRLAPRAAFATSFLPALAMSLLDRQGLFYLLLALPVLGLAWLRTRRGLPLLLGAAAAAAAWAAYNYVIGPFVIHAVNGYWPEMRFQRLRPRRLLGVEPWLEGARLLGDWTRVLFGGLPPLLPAGAAAAGLAAWAHARRARPGRALLVVLAALAGAAAQVAMLAIMVQRHDPVTWVDHRFWYYPLPFQALVAFGLLWGLEGATRRYGRLSRTVPAVLAALVVANVAQWPERRLVMRSGPWFGDVERRSAQLVRSLRGSHAETGLDGDYRRFYFECLDRFPSLRARAAAQVGEGDGLEVAETLGGRASAWARRESRLVARAKTAGRYVLAGSVVLRPGDDLRFLQGTPPRQFGRVARSGPDEGPEFFRLQVDLPAGPSDILLLSERPERTVRAGWRDVPAGFLLHLPVVVRPVVTPSARGSKGLQPPEAPVH
jgi:hypothetical protein